MGRQECGAGMGIHLGFDHQVSDGQTLGGLMVKPQVDSWSNPRWISSRRDDPLHRESGYFAVNTPTNLSTLEARYTCGVLRVSIFALS